MKWYKRYQITLTTVGPLHVGGLDDPLGSEGENPVALIGNRPCIPGPSLKGAYRAELERFLISKRSDALKPCLVSTGKSNAEEQLVKDGMYRQGSCEMRARLRPTGVSATDGTTARHKSICPACYVLGAQGLVGFVSVPFLMAKPGTQVESLYSSRINRATGTVTAGNRSYQLIGPDVQFTGELIILIEDGALGWKFGEKRPIRTADGSALDVDQWLDEPGDLPVGDQAVLLGDLVVERLKAIDVLGGYRSKGFGSVNIQVDEVAER